MFGRFRERVGIIEKMTFGQKIWRVGSELCIYLGGEHSRQRRSQCSGFEAGADLVCSRIFKKNSVAGVEWPKERQVANKISQVNEEEL